MQYSLENSRKIPVLLTSSVIAHDTGVSLQNSQDRIHFTLESIKHWLHIEPRLQIVLCDGSNYDFSKSVGDLFPESQIECLRFENDQVMVRKYGRGFGEGEIVRFAIQNSQLIAKAECFAKCTAKLWVQNFAECAANWNGKLRLKGVFSHVFSPFKATQLAYIDTRFYIASCEEYKRHFQDAHHLIRKDDGYGLEDCYRDIFLQKKLSASLFSVPPVIYGVGGGTGTYYQNSLIRRLKERLRLKWVKGKPVFASFF